MSVPASHLNLYSGLSPVEPVGTLALPVRDSVSAGTMMSLLLTDYAWLGNRTLDRFISQGSMLPLQRNQAISRMRGDWILFIDDDMTWQPSAMGRLVETYDELAGQFEEPIIVGGLCVRRTPPHQPTMYVKTEDNKFNFVEKWDTEIVEVDATGMAFCIIGIRALEAIAGGPMPPLEMRAKGAPAEFFVWMGSMGEDLRFCMDARKAGVRIFVDTRIEIGHVGEANYGIRDFWRAVAERDAEIQNARQVENDRMELPTMTQEEALQRLRST